MKQHAFFSRLLFLTSALNVQDRPGQTGIKPQRLQLLQRLAAAGISISWREYEASGSVTPPPWVNLYVYQCVTCQQFAN